MSTPRWSTPPSACCPTRRLIIWSPARCRSALAMRIPTSRRIRCFRSADGHIIIASGNDSQFAKLCAVLGEPELAKQEKYIDNKSRLAHRAELIGRLCGLTARLPREALLDKLEAVGVPAGPDQRPRSGVFRSASGASRHADRAAERGRGRRPDSAACARRSCSTASRWRPSGRRRGSANTPTRFCARSAKGNSDPPKGGVR